ncbi:MAG TPA: glycosyltransferase family 2 protein [Vicinamibacteria bacterium]|nr:glycosyltransferase family 2 protein [Vicinamibacteria bacterium]
MSTASRIGVVVLDFGRPDDAARAAFSARDPGLDVRVLVVDNGAGEDASGAVERLRLPENRGFAGGMNAGLDRLLSEGCDRVLLLNNDAVLEPGCLGRLAGALDDPRLAAVGPSIVRESDGRVESRGLEVDLRRGRVRLLGTGEVPQDGPPLVTVDALSGAAIMVSRVAVERVGRLEERYFFSFEDVDWCVRARRAGFSLAVLPSARARHAGRRTIGRGSADRLYYAARNHLRVAETLEPATRAHTLARRGTILALNLAHALRQRDLPRGRAVRAVLEGFQDACRGREGARPAQGR